MAFTKVIHYDFNESIKSTLLDFIDSFSQIFTKKKNKTQNQMVNTEMLDYDQLNHLVDHSLHRCHKKVITKQAGWFLSAIFKHISRMLSWRKMCQEAHKYQLCWHLLYRFQSVLIQRSCLLCWSIVFFSQFPTGKLGGLVRCRFN